MATMVVNAVMLLLNIIFYVNNTKLQKELKETAKTNISKIKDNNQKVQILVNQNSAFLKHLELMAEHMELMNEKLDN